MRSKKILLTLNALIVGTAAFIYGPRARKIYRRKTTVNNSFQIKNVGTGKVMRPLNANVEDGTPIIQYTPKNWECTTWQMIAVGANYFLLKDLFTNKTLRPVGAANNGSYLEQAAFSDIQNPVWNFEGVTDNQYRIRLVGTDLYITTSSAKLNAQLIIKQKTDNVNQLWTLKEQRPII